MKKKREYLIKNYLRTKACSLFCDYEIEVWRGYDQYLHNICITDKYSLGQRDMFDVVFYKIGDKNPSIVMLNRREDLFRPFIKDHVIEYVFRFMDINSNHVFMFETEYVDRLLEYDLPKNGLYCTRVGGMNDRDIEKMAVLECLREEGNKIGLIYINPYEAITEANSDVLFVWGEAWTKVDYDFSWICKHDNTHYNLKSHTAFKDKGVKIGSKLNVWRCF